MRTVQSVRSVSYPGNNIIVGVLDKVLGTRKGIGRVVKYIWQITGAAIGIYYGTFLLELVEVNSLAEFLRSFFAGLTVQTNVLVFSNGTIAVVVGLMVLYGLLSALSFTKAVYVCDAALLYTFLFIGLHVAQFPKVFTSLSLLYTIWIVHRVILAAIVLHYKKTKAAFFYVTEKEGVDNG
jgi:hypothetical protein